MITEITEQTIQGMNYYKTRLESVIQLYKEGNRELVNKNTGMVKTLIKGYKEFKQNPEYNPSLVDAIEMFILNKNAK